jgi:hypothetical protein
MKTQLEVVYYFMAVVVGGGDLHVYSRDWSIPKHIIKQRTKGSEPKKTLLLTSLLELQIGINKENSIKQSINLSINQSSKQSKQGKQINK